MIASGQEYGYTPAMLQATVEINAAQRASVIRKLQRELHSLKGRRIALLGLAFKPGTDDLRDAPALDIARRLLAAGAVISAFDPVVTALPEEFADVRLAPDAYAAADRADAVGACDGMAGVPPHRSCRAASGHAGRPGHRRPKLSARGGFAGFGPASSRIRLVKR